MDSNLQKQAEKHRRMTEEPVGPLICRLAGPCIISMLVTAFYNMADTFFVGLLNSNSATGAVGVAFSLMAVIQAIGFFFGQGLGNFVSRELGRQNRQAASEMAVTGVLLSFLCGALLALLGTLFLAPLLGFLGVQLAQPMADVFTFLVSTPFQFCLLRELKAEEQKHR